MPRISSGFLFLGPFPDSVFFSIILNFVSSGSINDFSNHQSILKKKQPAKKLKFSVVEMTFPIKQLITAFVF